MLRLVPVFAFGLGCALFLMTMSSPEHPVAHLLSYFQEDERAQAPTFWSTVPACLVKVPGLE